MVLAMMGSSPDEAGYSERAFTKKKGAEVEQEAVATRNLIVVPRN
jgi:hypothetical protein